MAAKLCLDQDSVANQIGYRKRRLGTEVLKRGSTSICAYIRRLRAVEAKSLGGRDRV